MIALLATMAAVAASTLPATNVTNTTATLNGSVSGATTAHFEYAAGPLTNPLVTANQSVSDGNVSASVTGLSPNTTYRFRIVSDAGNGDELTFRTAPNPTPPGVTDQHATAVTTSGAHLSASLDPNGAATTYYFQYGRSTGYGNRSTPVTMPAGANPVAVAADVRGLRPYTRYHWRLYTRNSAGITRGRDHTFRTGRVASSITLYSSRAKVAYGGGVTLGGRVTGAGTNGMTLRLEQQAFPFGSAFAAVRTTKVAGDGGYLFSVDNVWALTRFRVVTETQAPLTSAVTAVKSAPRTTIAAKLLGRKRARISGRIRPAISGDLSLQRRSASGRWRQVKHRPLTAAKRYSFKVFRARKVNRAYRVVVLPTRGAYVKARTRKVTITRRPARARGHRAAAG